MATTGALQLTSNFTAYSHAGTFGRKVTLPFHLDSSTIMWNIVPSRERGSSRRDMDWIGFWGALIFYGNTHVECFEFFE